MTGEKRRYKRFHHHALRVTVTRPGIRGFILADPTGDCLNFSRTGLQFDSHTELSPGEMLLVDIEIDEIHLQELKAEVITKVAGPNESGTELWCHGLRFCLEEAKQNEVFHRLLLIEDRLKNLDQYG